MDRRALPVAAFALLVLSLAHPALAQRFTFDRSFDVDATPTLDVSTVRGKIAVTAGQPGRVVVRGTVTVRVGVDVPADAVAIAQQAAADPPLSQSDDAVRLATPTDGRVRRAVTVSYEVQVPPVTRVTTTSESGETHVTGVTGPVVVRTQSGAIAVARLGGNADVATGSGAVEVDTVAGILKVTTSSSGIAARAIRGGLYVRTQSGSVEATMAGGGDVDVHTGSSGVRLHGVSGPTAVETGSGRIEIWLAPGVAVTLDALTRSGGVDVRAVKVDGTIDKRHVVGKIRGGGAQMTLVTRSGSIKIAD
jgi:Putative adhesin